MNGNGRADDGESVIRCRGVWKIFGASAAQALAAIRERGLDKRQVRDEFGCVVGVADASFDVRAGEIFCVMGLSGSGKSTLIRHINRLIEPTAGDIFVEGENIGRLSDAGLRHWRARKVGMVFQNIALLPHHTARDNAALALEIRGADKQSRREAAQRALEEVGLAGWEDRYPDELSGGMQQRVGLARALAADPDILLMDEPFSALDPLIRRQLQDQFIELSRRMKKTTVFITHDLDEAIRIGGRIAIMKDGALVQTGTPEEIVSAPADDYVADFVAGISRLHLITAGRIMEPAGDAGVAGDGRELPSASPSADLDELINLSIDASGPVVIKEANGRTVGIVTKERLLRGVQGRIAAEAEA